MSNEEFERKMAFIVEQEAQFSSDIQQLREAQTKTDQLVAQTGEIVARLANATLEGFKDVNAKINALIDSQIGLNEDQARMLGGFKYVNGKIDPLVDFQIRLNEAQSSTDENVSRTDESLRNLIAVVDRYLTMAVTDGKKLKSFLSISRT